MNKISSRFKPLIDDGAESMDTAESIDYPEGQHPRDAMHHPYQLYGVATRRDVVYLLHPDASSNDPGAKQWWRMQYDTESSNPTIMRDRLSFQDVIKRAISESASALLVYANATATSAQPLPLSAPLEDFVNKDKLIFLEELQQTNSVWEDYEDDYGNSAQGGWDKDRSAIDYDWSNMNPSEFHRHDRNDSNISSTTLTPNTELDDTEGVREMIEVNGGMDALTGISRSASTVTIGRDSDGMDLDTASSPVKATFEDVDLKMGDVRETESQTQHFDGGERKGG